jgi:hypothetical protein
VNGIARTVWVLLWGRGLQSWLMVIGSAMTLATLGALAAHWYPSAHSRFVFWGLIGVMLTVISPLFANAIVFRSICAPRSTWLIPRGRLKLAAGAFLSHLLLAVFIGVAVGALLPVSPSGAAVIQSMTKVFAIAFALLTLHFLCFYWAAQFRMGILIFWPYAVAIILLAGLPRSHLGATLASPIGLGAAATASLLAWALFAIRLVTVRHITLPEWAGTRSGSAAAAAASADIARRTAQYNTQQALWILLGGIANPRRVMFLTTLGMCIVFAAVMLGILLGKPSGKATLMWAFVICLFGALIPVMMADAMSRRARYLWLKPGLGRAELFKVVERSGWRLLLAGSIAALLLAAPLVIYGTRFQHLAATVFAIQAAPLSLCAALFYVWLLQVRGGRFGDRLIMVVATAIVMLEVLFGEATFVNWTWQSDPATMLLPLLVGVHIVLVPVFRFLAQRRWQRIDWLIHKPVR